MTHLKNEDFLSKFSNLRKTAQGYMARCPAHEDRESSLSISEADDGGILIHCFAGCLPEEIVKTVGLTLRDLFPDEQRKRGSFTPPTTVQHCNGGLTLEEYAEAKRLPVEFLKSLGLSTITYRDRKAVRIPYFDKSGQEAATRFRLELNKREDGTDNRFVWKKGLKSFLYGLNRTFKEPFRILVEGESDCHTLWHTGFPALGLPGADNWREDRDSLHFERISEVFVVIEPDKGGEAVKKWLAKSSIRSRARLVSLAPYKDPSSLYLAEPETWRTTFEKALQESTPWTDQEKKRRAIEESLSWGLCRDLALKKSILDEFSNVLRGMGVVGEERTGRLIFLAMVSRYLTRPISIAVKGPSSGGKSFLVESVLKFFPPSAYYALSSMSEHSLAYSAEPLQHRFLVLYEAAGLTSDLASYLLRSLLSEGCVRYETVEKTSEGMKPKLITREGPTGAIITTTAVKLHPENETRMLSLSVSDSREQTRAVLLSLAQVNEQQKNFKEWHALQTWLDYTEHRVTIPFAQSLASKVPPVAIRLRRDFTQILNLIKANAILHQKTRERDFEGRIIASFEDYCTVRELVADIISDGVGSTVPPSVREAVEVVAKIIPAESGHVTVKQVAEALKIDKSSASRRVKDATDRGFLRNLEPGRGRPAKIVLGDPLPDDSKVLPDVAEIGESCTVAGVQEGINILPSSLPGSPGGSEFNLLEGEI